MGLAETRRLMLEFFLFIVIFFLIPAVAGFVGGIAGYFITGWIKGQ